MTMTVNGAPCAAFVCTRADLPCLAAGRLLGDGRIRCRADVRSITFRAEESLCAVTAADAPAAAPAPVPIAWEREWIFAAARRFAEATPLYHATASVHLAFLWRGDRLLYTAEDISRRCAMEKALGFALLHEEDLPACWLYLSCRVNADLVRQAANAGIALLVSKSTPTADAVELAGALGVSLICRAWPDRFEVYNG